MIISTERHARLVICDTLARLKITLVHDMFMSLLANSQSVCSTHGHHSQLRINDTVFGHRLPINICDS